MSWSKEPTFENMPLMSEAESVAGRVVAIAKDGRVLASGSCVRIAAGLYLTAGHVVRDFLDKFGDTNMHANFSIWILHLHAGLRMEVWALTKFWLPTNTDIAVLRSIPYSEETRQLSSVNTVGIDLAPPPIGSRVFAFGFHSTKGEISIDADLVNLDIWGKPATAVGEIRHIHDLQRDSVNLKFPCFQVNAQFDGGMSGGPIFSDNGKLCGIICSSFSTEGMQSESISYAATLWPVLATALDIDIRTGEPCEPYCMIELSKQGLISVQNPHLFTATMRDGEFFGTYLRPN